MASTRGRRCSEPQSRAAEVYCNRVVMFQPRNTRVKLSPLFNGVDVDGKQ